MTPKLQTEVLRRYLEWCNQYQPPDLAYKESDLKLRNVTTAEGSEFNTTTAQVDDSDSLADLIIIWDDTLDDEPIRTILQGFDTNISLVYAADRGVYLQDKPVDESDHG